MADSQYSVPLLRGLTRPPLILGVNGQFLILAIVLAIPGPYVWQAFVASGLAYVVGLVFARISPNYLGDVGRYLRWRAIAPSGYIADETFRVRDKG